ncbi:MAG: GTP-binding protein [Candidatus Helarchaeota archaeon]
MKIIVTGPFHAGKSTFVKMFCNKNSINLQKMGIDGLTTVALDFGIREFEDLKISVFGTPGKTHFSVVREVLSLGADGIIFVIDSADPTLDEETKLIWAEIKKYLPDVPIVFVANKQDLPIARSIEELRETFGFLNSDDVNIVPTVAKDNSNLDQAMHILLRKCIDKILPLMSQLNKYHGKVQGVEKLAKELNKPITEIRAYLRWLENRMLLSVDWRHHVFWLSDSIKHIMDGLGKKSPANQS